MLDCRTCCCKLRSLDVVTSHWEPSLAIMSLKSRVVRLATSNSAFALSSRFTMRSLACLILAWNGCMCECTETVAGWLVSMGSQLSASSGTTDTTPKQSKKGGYTTPDSTASVLVLESNFPFCCIFLSVHPGHLPTQRFSVSAERFCQCSTKKVKTALKSVQIKTGK